MLPHHDAHTSHTGQASSRQHTGDGTVLVVDDTPDKRQLLESLLCHSGYRVLTAGDGREGLLVARSARPDLIISDVSMPLIDGIELCRRIRADDDLRLTPILLVSALRKDSESVAAGLSAGADDYIEAPYDPMRLVAKITRYAERKRTEEALRQSVEHYRLLFESNPLPMWVFDRETLRFLAVNAAAVRHYGYSHDEFLAMTIKDIRPPEALPELAAALSASSVGLGFSGLMNHRKKDGNVIDVEITYHTLTFGDRPAELVLAQDVTERRRIEKELHQSQEQLLQSQKLESVGQLAGGVAHDFNNLLTVIIGQSDLMLRRLAGDDPLRSRAEEIKRAAERAAGLTRQLLAFSRKQVLQPKVLDLTETVAGMDKLLRRLIGEDVHLLTVLASRLGKVKADPSQIEQVLMNLAVNARDAMPEGGKLTVETQNVYLDEAYARQHLSVVPGPYVMLAVSDTGTGMDAETQARIFEPFFTTKEVGKGTGLGLSTVYGIVKQSGGNIYVYSEVGNGTTFKIYLPLVSEESEANEQFLAEPARERRTETILLVEDEESVRTLLLETLEAEGYTVLAASGGREALRVCAGHAGPIHLLLTDVVMPEMSGRQLVERLNEKCAGAKVLYMSGYTDNAIVRHGVLEPGVSFLQKPFTPAAVIRKVREVLDADDS
ncbi:MAG TPA: response regulator [Pyrinomonadaceae bacterium]|nr:response regulator [Pyrinomonadaceae bacterium]